MCWCLIADLITHPGNSYWLKYLLRWGSWKYEVIEVLRVIQCRKRGKIRINARELDERLILRGTFYFIASVSLCLLVGLTIPLTGSSNTSCNALWAPQSASVHGSRIAADCKPDSCQDTLSTLKTGFNQIPKTQLIIGTLEKQDWGGNGGRGRPLNTRKTKLNMFLCPKYANVSS